MATRGSKSKQRVGFGDGTLSRYRYQFGYGVILLIATRKGPNPYSAIWCERDEDFLGEMPERGGFDAFQIKTLEGRAWRVTDDGFLQSIANFILHSRQGMPFNRYCFVSNAAAPDIRGTSNERISLDVFLGKIRAAEAPCDLPASHRAAFEHFASAIFRKAQCDKSELWKVLKRFEFIQGPSLDIHDHLCQSHLPQLPEFRGWSAENLADAARAMVARIFEASSLFVQDGFRHYVTIAPLQAEKDPLLLQKRLTLQDLIGSASPFAPSIAIPKYLGGIPHRANCFFTGREVEMRRLHAKGSSGWSVLCGRGGSGKTQLAAEFCHQIVADGFSKCGHPTLTAVLWVNATSESTVKAGLATLVSPLWLNLGLANDLTVDERLAKVLSWFKDNYGWVLVLDNADAPQSTSAVVDYLGYFGNGRVIVTSRHSAWPADLELIAVGDELSSSEAAEFLVKRVDNPLAGGLEEAHRLAGRLTNFPLALEQAAAFIRERQDGIQIGPMTFLEYVEHLNMKGEVLLDRGVQGWTKYEESVVSTLKMSTAVLSMAARIILRICSLCASAPIPVGFVSSASVTLGNVILELGGGIMTSSDGSEKLSEEAIADALNELHKYFLVRKGERVIVINSLIQEIERASMSLKRRGRWLEWVMRCAQDATAEDRPNDFQFWEKWETFSPHIVEFLAQASEAKVSSEIEADLCDNLGLFRVGKALYREAEPLHQRALKLREANAADQSLSIANSCRSLARLLIEQGRYAEAEPFSRRNLQIRLDRFGPQHREVGACCKTLSSLLRGLARYGEAEALARRALEIFEQEDVLDHWQIATLCGNMALVLSATNRLIDAEKYSRRFLARLLESLRPNHPEIATALSNLAKVLQLRRELTEAEGHARRAIEIRVNGLGLKHRHISSDYVQLASILREQMQHAEAERLVSDACTIDEAALGPDHYEVGLDRAELARIYSESGRLGDADKLWPDALSLIKRGFVTPHDMLGRAHLSYAEHLVRSANYREAEIQASAAVGIFQDVLGIEHPDWAHARSIIVDIRLRMGGQASR